MPSLAENSERVEIRCPTGAKKLLMVVRRLQETPVIVDGNLLELPCPDCRQNVAAIKGRKPKRVLHRFNVLGDLVESEIEWSQVVVTADIVDDETY